MVSAGVIVAVMVLGSVPLTSSAETSYAPGWSVAEIVEGDDAGDAFYPSVAIDDEGNVMAVWHQSDGAAYSIWASRYMSPDTTPPPLVLSSPSEGEAVEAPVVSVSGTTEPGVALAVDGLLVTVASDGSFSCTVSLPSGSNVVTVTATDGGGSSVTAGRTVIFVDPTVALEGSLDALGEDLEDAQGAVR